MKKLFTLKDNNLLLSEVKDSIYSAFSFSENKYTFFDCEGNVLENYTLPTHNYKPVEINDPDFFEDIGEGFYSYTTHKVNYDVDGNYGLFGIKYNNGRKLTQEKFCQVNVFCNGLCSVSEVHGKWGCINTKGELVIPYKFSEEMFFNKYGVAVGDSSLIDKKGNKIPHTYLNSIEECSEYNRYYAFSLLNEDQNALIEKCGTAPNITVDIYDTKNLSYVVQNIPECHLDVFGFNGEPEVVLAAAKLIEQYESVHLSGKGTVFCKKNGFVTAYDYYQ